MTAVATPQHAVAMATRASWVMSRALGHQGYAAAGEGHVLLQADVQVRMGDLTSVKCCVCVCGRAFS